MNAFSLVKEIQINLEIYSQEGIDEEAIPGLMSSHGKLTKKDFNKKCDSTIKYFKLIGYKGEVAYVKPDFSGNAGKRYKIIFEFPLKFADGDDQEQMRKWIKTASIFKNSLIRASIVIGIIEKLRISEVGLNGGKILNGLINAGVVKDISDEKVNFQKVCLNPNLNQKENMVREIAKEDFDKIWTILQEACQGMPRPFDVHIPKNASVDYSIQYKKYKHPLPHGSGDDALFTQWIDKRDQWICKQYELLKQKKIQDDAINIIKKELIRLPLKKFGKLPDKEFQGDVTKHDFEKIGLNGDVIFIKMIDKDLMENVSEGKGWLMQDLDTIKQTLQDMFPIDTDKIIDILQNSQNRKKDPRRLSVESIKRIVIN